MTDQRAHEMTDFEKLLAAKAKSEADRKRKADAAAAAASPGSAPGNDNAVKPEQQGSAQPLPRESAQQQPLILDDIRDLQNRELVRRLIERGPDGTGKTSEQAQRVIFCALIAAGWSNEKIFATVTDERYDVGRFIRASGDSERRIKALIDLARTNPIKMNLSATDWSENARKFRAIEMPNLVRSNGDFYDYHKRGAYREIDDDTIKSRGRKFLDNGLLRKKDGDEWKYEPFEPNNQDVNELLGATKDLNHLDRDDDPPVFLSGRTDPDPKRCVAFPNGILDLKTGKLHEPTQDYFTHCASEFDYDPNAAEPELWKKTLNEQFPENKNGAAHIKLAQEMFGYAVSPDTDLQKILFSYGRKRSGKGTHAYVVQRLIGKGNYGSPSLKDLGENFGLHALVNKKLTMISDMKLGRKADQEEIVQNLKRISGEDSISVQRKFKLPWEGRLNTKIWIFSNTLPGMQDSSGALAARLIILPMTETFYGRENLALKSQLEAELPGILNWALEGYRRLRAQGHFSETDEGHDAMSAIDNAGSPIKSFVADRCELDPEAKTIKNDVFAAWRRWCLGDGGGRPPGTLAQFAAQLMSAYPGQVRPARPRVDGGGYGW